MLAVHDLQAIFGGRGCPFKTIHVFGNTRPPEPLTRADEETFETLVLRATRPVLVLFGVPDCGPCRVAADEMAVVSEEYQGRVFFVSVDGEESPALMARYGICGVPTLLLFKAGTVVDCFIGAAPQEVLRAKLEAALRQGKDDRGRDGGAEPK